MSPHTLASARAVRRAIAHPVEPEPRECGSLQRTRHATIVALCLATMIVVFATRCFVAARRNSITSDESTHFVHGLRYWMTGDDNAMWELGAPRLPHALGTFASTVALRSAGLLPHTADTRAIETLVLSGAARVLVPARCVAIVWGIALLLVVYWAIARTHGALLGLLAAGLLSVVPEVLAHSAIAGSDIPFTAAAFLAIVLMARYVERPTMGRWIAVSGAIGLAWAMRHSALLLLPLAAGTQIVAAYQRHQPRGLPAISELVARSVVACTVMVVVAFSILWLGDGLQTLELKAIAARVPGDRVPARLGPLDWRSWPVPTSALSVLKQIRHQNQGHEAYFCGEYRQTGWPLYFPIAFLLKTPIGFLALMVLAAARIRPRATLEAIALAALLLLWMMLVRNKVNIGVRYALLTYPLAVVFIARLFERRTLRDWVWGPLTIAAAVGLAAASFTCHERFLSYFNEIGGGPRQGWLYLADSNIDWGQDFDALAAAVVRLGIRDLTTDISSDRPLRLPGVFTITNRSRAFQVPDVTSPNRRLYDSDGGYLPIYTRYVAVGITRFLGLYSQNDMSWLRTRRLVERVGDSILVFDMDTPADRPFAP